MKQDIIQYAQTLLEYHRLGHQLTTSDCILGFGTNDSRVAECAAELFLDGLAPILVFSGSVSTWTAGLYPTTEAVHFAQIAISRGVPESAILIEPKATNTGENVKFSRILLEQRGCLVKRAIVVQKPYMERRSFATFRKFWPEPEVRTASPRLSLMELELPHLSFDEVINIMVGDFDRIRIYPDKGFQIPQEIAPEALVAFEHLVALGFNKYLVS